MIVLQAMLDQMSIGGDVNADVLNRASGGVPLFGSIALHLVGNEVRSSRVFYNGKPYSDRVVIVLLSGSTTPRFFLETIMEKKNFTQKAAITGAKGNKLLSINNMPAVNYMKKIGFEGLTYATYHAIPLLIESGDGSAPQIFISSSTTPDGALTLSGTAPPRGTLMVGAYSSDDVLTTAKKLVDSIKKAGEENEKYRTVLIFSCLSRKTVLYNSRLETELVRRELEGSGLSSLFIYSAGEFCPWHGPKTGKESNRFHNFVIVACLF
jgi:hypothetical protein